MFTRLVIGIGVVVAMMLVVLLNQGSTPSQILIPLLAFGFIVAEWDRVRKLYQLCLLRVRRDFQENERNDRRRGFTPMELLIVVAIIGVLAAIFIPNLIVMQKRAKMTEARENLSQIWVLQEAYRMRNNTYVAPPSALPPGTYDGSRGWDEMGFYPEGMTRYAYSVTSAGATTFRAHASGNIDDDIENDVWMITETGQVKHTQID